MRNRSQRRAGIVVGLTMAGWLVPPEPAHAQAFSCPAEPFVFEWSLPDGATDVEVRANGEVYVLISDIIDQVNAYDYRGNLLRSFSSSGNAAGQLRAPFDMTLDSQGNTYVLDVFRRKILKFDGADLFVSEWDSDPPMPSQGAFGIFFGQDGFLYAVKPSQIHKFDPDGGFQGTITLTGDPATHGIPFHMARTPAGDFLIGFFNTSPGQFKIRKFDALGAYLTGFAPEGNGPAELRSVNDIFLDSAGNLYAVDSNFGSVGSKVNVYDTSGTYLATFGNEGEKLLEPSGIAMREDKGTVYVTDRDAGNTFARVMAFNCQPVGQPTAAIVGVTQDGGANLEVDGSVDDPDAERLDVDVQLYCPAAVQVTLGSSNGYADEVPGESGAAIARPPTTGTGLISVPQGHFDFACGTCATPLSAFASSLQPHDCGVFGNPEGMVEVDICARSSVTGRLYTLDVTSYAAQHLDPNASYRRFQFLFGARYADRLPPYTVPATSITSTPPPGETCEIGLSALDYFTPKVTATGSALYQGETRIVFPPFGPAALIGLAIDLVATFDLPAGIENGLMVKLENAQQSLDEGNVTAACGKVDAFIQQAEAQSGNALTAAQTSELVAGANDIKAALGCR